MGQIKDSGMTVETGKNIADSGEVIGNHDSGLSASSGSFENQVVDGARDLGLDPKRILAHWKRLFHCHGAESGETFELLDTCRKDNGRLLELERILAGSEVPKSAELSGYAAFVPAAGAASRYMSALEPLRKSVECWDFAAISGALRDLLPFLGVLPERLQEMISAPSSGLSDEDRKWLKELFRSPKALLPCEPGGLSFLAQKAREHNFFDCFKLQIFVTPPGQKDTFQACIEGEMGPEKAFYEQGVACSTLRFSPDGQPVRNEKGLLSQVPAGHGSLANLFPKIARDHSQVEALFIRNIDNVCGVNQKCRELTHEFLGAHTKVLKIFQSIRKVLQGNRPGIGFQDGLLSLQRMGDDKALSDGEQSFLRAIPNERSYLLWEILFRLFQTPLSEVGQGKDRDLLRLFERPVTLMGQVKNLGHDKGGSPVVVQTKDGPMSLCLERPHASLQDQKEVLDNPKKATHFNPVFAATELGAQPSFNDAQTDFWLMAKKNWQGKKVVYYETILYEILGNCKTMNCIFVEVPRYVFNPRKSLADALTSVSGHPAP